MIDILYLAKGRPEFTAASLLALMRNTDWRTARLNIYTDGDPDTHVRSVLATHNWPLQCVNWINITPLGGPIEVMCDFIKHAAHSGVFAKIDNDCCVPPCWLQQSLDIMHGHPELHILGIEPGLSRTRAPWSTRPPEPTPESKYVARYGQTPGYAPCDSIGGVGLMRRKVFEIYPDMAQHHTYGGFSDWQLRHADVVKGWIVPPLRLFLLDRLNFSPWKELSAKYIANGEQRPWTMYPQTSSILWQWWLDEQKQNEELEQRRKAQ